MPPAEALVVVQALEAAGAQVWLVGGWAVDALIGHQTRPHEDLDLVVPVDDVDLARRSLERLGYVLRIEHDLGPGLWMPVRILYRSPSGRSVEVHPVRLTPSALHAVRGPGSLQVPRRGSFMPGRISGREVPCLSPAVQLRFKEGYDWDPEDARDVILLEGLC